MDFMITGLQLNLYFTFTIVKETRQRRKFPGFDARIKENALQTISDFQDHLCFSPAALTLM